MIRSSPLTVAAGRARDAAAEMTPSPATAYDISTRRPSRTHTAIAMALAFVCFGAFLLAIIYRHVQLARQDASPS